MNIILDRMAGKRFLISDGAWGTELGRRGLEAGVVPEMWNLERPEDVLAVAAAYVEAGSEIILTNTFGGSSVKLARAGLEDRVFEINRRGAEISKEAAAGKALVFASIGPTGEFMEPLGSISEETMIACFAVQAKALVQGGADGFVIETMTDLGEAKAALRAVKDNTDMPVVVSMTFDKGIRGYATMMGVRPDLAAAELEEAGADAVGSNCGSGIENMIEVAEIMRGARSVPLWIKPNAGLPALVHGQTVFRETPEEMAARIPALVTAGAQIIGGCCGTTPDHIRLIVETRRALQ